MSTTRATFADLAYTADWAKHLRREATAWMTGRYRANAEETEYQKDVTARRAIEVEHRLADLTPEASPAFDVAKRLDAVGLPVAWVRQDGLLDRFEVDGTDLKWTYSPTPLIDGKPYGLPALMIAYDGDVEIAKIVGADPVDDELASFTHEVALRAFRDLRHV